MPVMGVTDGRARILLERCRHCNWLTAASAGNGGLEVSALRWLLIPAGLEIWTTVYGRPEAQAARRSSRTIFIPERDRLLEWKWKRRRGARARIHAHRG